MQRRLLLLTCTALTVLLTACNGGQSQTLVYDVTADAPNDAQALKLLLDLEEVLERRSTLRPDFADLAITVTPRKGNRGTLTIGGITTNAQADAVRGMLASPFTFEIRRELPAPPEPTGTGVVATSAEREWEQTGIDGEHLTGVVPIQQEGGAVGAELLFTDEGRRLFVQLIQEYPGATIGIFVRDLLISQLTIAPDATAEDRIVISGIPSYEVAEIFADDVNVGLHTHLSPR